MNAVLLTDFGSTFTKVTAVDTDTETVLGTASAHTTVQTDINEGLHRAMELLEAITGPVTYSARYACSSAAGGLKMIASGLVPDLTAQAARTACLGAGAKVLKSFAYELTEDDADEIRSLRPDIFLLCGGTDGGNDACILHNAAVVASVEQPFPVIVAGNRTAARRCKELLAPTHEVIVCENVMPRFGVMNIAPVQQHIRTLFLERIVAAKGLTEAKALQDGILMPTPAAVLEAVRLLADGTGSEPGIGELICVDVGGATTDVYSVAKGEPTAANTVVKGLPEPYRKRTVEGDIGMRWSVRGIAEAAGMERVASMAGLTVARTEELVRLLGDEPSSVPSGNDELASLDDALASLAVEVAVRRHAGTVEQTWTNMGLTFIQTGKDLRDVRQIVLTGGSLIRSAHTGAIASHAFSSPDEPFSLRPREAVARTDRKYILAAMGLLAERYPEAALHIMKKEIKPDGTEK